MHDDPMAHECNNRLHDPDLAPAASQGLLVWPVDGHCTSEGLSVYAVWTGGGQPPGKNSALECFPGMSLVGTVLETELFDAEALAPEGMVGPLYAAVLLGSSNRGWMRGSGTWTARRDDLTPEGAALLEILDQLYGEPAQLLTFLDT